MKRVLLAFALLVAATAARAAPPPELEAALVHAMADSKVPALGALMIRGGKAGEPAVRGVRRIGQADPIRPGDRWLLGSDGKAMTATLVARLVDQGRLSWDAPLEKMLPDLAAGMRPEYRSAT